MEHSQKNAEPRTGALRMEPHEREEQILKIAAEHFTRRGVLGASMSAIARDAGITRALLYHYFPGKESLAAAVTRREANAVLEALGEHHENPEEALRRELRTYFLVVAGVPTPVERTSRTTPPTTSNGCLNAPECRLMTAPASSSEAGCSSSTTSPCMSCSSTPAIGAPFAPAGSGLKKLSTCAWVSWILSPAATTRLKR